MFNIKIKKYTLFLVFLSFLIGFSYRHSNPSYLGYLKNKFEIKFQKIFNIKFKKDASKKFVLRKSQNFLITQP